MSLRTSFDHAHTKLIGTTLDASIDSAHTDQGFTLPNHCYLSFALNTQNSATVNYSNDETRERDGNYSISRCDEYDEDYRREEGIENQGFHMEEARFNLHSHTSKEATSIDTINGNTIDINEGKSIDTSTYASIGPSTILI
ncbi:Uncharacterized protein Rs2_38621 [Raphanus sativus]|nr:Uncharacterized protein Rs2_38621 [Raphanus sativus]